MTTGERSFASQPYEQLARVYRQSGRESDARRVAIASRNDARRFGQLTGLSKFGNWLMDKTIKHGYQPMRALGLLLIVYFVVLLTGWFGQHQETGPRHSPAIVATHDTAKLNPRPTALDCQDTYPCFYPPFYALDVVLPIVNVGRADNWRPNGHARWGWVYVIVTRLAILMGWALTTLAVVGYTGLVRRS